MTSIEQLDANDPLVVEQLKKLNVTVSKKNETTLPEVAEPAAAPVKKKKIQIELDAISEARLLRESAANQETPKEFLQRLIDEHFKEHVGRPIVTGPSFSKGAKIKGPTNDYGRKGEF